MRVCIRKYISAKIGIDDHLMLFQIVRAKGKISTFKSNLSGERSDFLYKRNLSHERWTYSLIILEITQSFVTSRRFLNFAIRTH